MKSRIPIYQTSKGFNVITTWDDNYNCIFENTPTYIIKEHEKRDINYANDINRSGWEELI